MEEVADRQTVLKSLDDAKTTGEVLKLSTGFLYQAVRQGKIPFYRAGRAIRFNTEEIKTWMREQARK